MLIFSNFTKDDNIGDLSCCPLLYDGSDFPTATHVDFASLNAKSDDVVVLGGGGMLHEWAKLKIETLSKTTRVIVWGIGSNDHDTCLQSFPPFLGECELVGLRDYGNPYRYVPCPSCLSSEFDMCQPPTQDVVIFEHKDKRIPIIDFPKMNNSAKNKSLRDVIRFLCLGQTVITNSYHGAYWSMLLGRKVLIWEPFSSRFFGFKYRVTVCSSVDWLFKLPMAVQADSEYLSECRKLNYNFHDDVITLMIKLMHL